MGKKVITATLGLTLLLGGAVQAGTTIVDIEDSAFKEAIQNVVDKGYMGFTSKEENIFNPTEHVTREQLAQILTNFETKFEEDLESKHIEYHKELESTNEELTMVSKVMKSLVRVDTHTSKGSGVFISEDTILTAYHVIDNATDDKVEIRLSDYKSFIKGIVIAKDEWNDLALVKIDDTLKSDNYVVNPLSLSESNAILGETVYAFGNPLSVDFTVTKGIVSSLSQTLALRSYLQFDGVIYPGNSGGPLVNTDGELVGVVVSILKDSMNRETYTGINFSVQTNSVKTFLEDNGY